MATIFSNASGQVVEAADVYGTYYYIADGLGEPVVGAWSDREAAIAALESGEEAGRLEGDLEIDDKGYRLVECAYCGCKVRPGDANTPTPDADDEAAWDELAAGHGEGCEWIETRSHKVD